MEDFLPFSLHQLRYGDSRPSCHDSGNFFLRYGIAHERSRISRFPGAFLAFLLRLFQLFFKLRQCRISELCRLFIFIIPLRRFDLAVHAVNFFLCIFDCVNFLLLRFPSGFHFVESIAQLCKLLSNLFGALLGKRIRFLFQRHFLNFQLHDLTPDIIDFRRHGVDFRPNLSARLIHQIDRLVRQETVCNIPVRQRRSGNKRTVVNLYAVENLVFLLEPS